MTPADSLSQITIFQLMVIRVLCNQKCVFNIYSPTGLKFYCSWHSTKNKYSTSMVFIVAECTEFKGDGITKIY